jgi:hypothetical protein
MFADLEEVKGLGFCVSPVGHAAFYDQYGLSARAFPPVASPAKRRPKSASRAECA